MQDTKASEANIQLNYCTFLTFQSFLRQHCSQTFTSSQNYYGVHRVVLLPEHVLLFQIIGQFNVTTSGTGTSATTRSNL